MPRVIPDGIVVYPPRPTLLDPPDVKAAERGAEDGQYDALVRTRQGPYAPGSPFSYFRDILTLHRAAVRRDGTFDDRATSGPIRDQIRSTSCPEASKAKRTRNAG